MYRVDNKNKLSHHAQNVRKISSIDEVTIWVKCLEFVIELSDVENAKFPQDLIL